MLVPDNYREIVRNTFIERAIRSAILIDDQFPRFDEALDDAGSIRNNYKEVNRAHMLYSAFRERHILCDVENQVPVIDEAGIVDRARKSDFVLLDYHLTADEKDNSHSIRLLKRLSQSHHFNVVVVYTKHPDLSEVWRDIAINMRGGWRDATSILGQARIDQWDDLEEDHGIPDLEEAVLKEYLKIGDGIKRKRTLIGDLRSAFVNSGVEHKDAGDFIIAAIHKQLRTRSILGQGEDQEPAELVCDYCEEGPFWIQCGNAFIAIVKKHTGTDVPEDPNKIFQCLEDALVAWQPNIIQILLSEIQNILEMDGVAIDPDYSGTPERQIGIGYHLLSALPPRNAHDFSGVIDAAITSTVGKITELIQNRITSDKDMLAVLRNLVGHLLSSNQWRELPVGRQERVKELVKFTKQVLNKSDKLKNERIFVDLNAFLSTEAFSGVNVTTGTIFSNLERTEWWLCCSPACDMAPREPGSTQIWLSNINPSKSMLALRLEESSRSTALKDAERGTTIFIGDNTATEGYRYFNALAAAGQPLWEVMMVEDYGKTLESDGVYHFNAQRLSRDGQDGDSNLRLGEASQFMVQGQLRPEYGARLLQIAGQHLSRVGVDFVNLPH